MRKTLPVLIIFAAFLAGCIFPAQSHSQSEIVAVPSSTTTAETQVPVETSAAKTETVPTKESDPTLTPTLEPTPTAITLPPRNCGVPGGTILYLAMQGDNGVKDVLSIDPDGTGFNEIPDARRVEQFLLPHPNGESFLHQNNMTYFFTRNMDGSNPIQLTENVIFPDEVKYSPDGSRIAYIAYLGKTHHIYIMDADGSNLFTLTNFAAHTDSEEEVEFPSDLFSFDWSPNGLHIIFEGEMNGQRDIFSIELDGSNLRNLTNTPDLNEFGPIFSPNGSLIAYSAGTSTESDLYLMSPEGTNQHRIIDLDGRSFQPVWSPDNYQIAFISNRDGDEEVYVIDPDGENFAQLTFNETREYWLDWSPDSCWLAYRSVVDDTGISEIFRTSPDGSETFQITNRKSWILRFYWVDN